MNIGQLIFILVILLLILDIYIRVKVEYQVDQNLGHIRLYLFGIRVISFDFTLVLKHFKYSSKPKNVIRIKIDPTAKSVIFAKILFSNIRKKTVLRICRVDAVIHSRDIMLGSVLGGLSNVILAPYMTTLKSRHIDADIFGQVDVSYSEDNIKFAGDLAINITLFDIIVGLINTIYAFWRWGNEIKKRQIDGV